MGKLSLKIDSGAVDTVIPPSTGRAFPVKPSEMSRAGLGYRAANGSPIPAHGERYLSGVSDNWIPFNIKAQVAGVRSPLGSVMHMIKAGNKLVFDSQGSYMQNKQSGRILPIHEREGGFELDLWIEECMSPDITEKSNEKPKKKIVKYIRSWLRAVMRRMMSWAWISSGRPTGHKPSHLVGRHGTII